MRTIDEANASTLGARAWRDLGRLAAEALAIGVIFSVLLALAVFVAARNGHGDTVAQASEAQSPIVASHPG
jgi:hypothetical protein